MEKLEMPNDGVGENSSASGSSSETPTEVATENYSGVRVRDTKTGRFVSGPNPHLVVKDWKSAAGMVGAGAAGGVLANQIPQNTIDWKKQRRKLRKLNKS